MCIWNVYKFLRFHQLSRCRKVMVRLISVSEMADSQIYSKCKLRVVIGHGLAHNNSRFILVQAIVPYVQLGSVGCIA
jgi:hypothetical protein